MERLEVPLFCRFLPQRRWVIRVVLRLDMRVMWLSMLPLNVLMELALLVGHRPRPSLLEGLPVYAISARSTQQSRCPPSALRPSPSLARASLLDRGGERAASNVEETADSGLRQAYTNTFTFTSSSPALDPSFYFIRTPYKPFHSLTARRGYLQLFGNAYAPGGQGQRGARIAQADGDNCAGEAGRAVGAYDGECDETTVNCYELATKDAPVRFQIAGNSTSYTLGYAEGTASNFTSLATIDSAALSIAPAGGFFFKGTSFGIYNTGNGRPSLVPADSSTGSKLQNSPALTPLRGRLRHASPAC
ncbi:hypothetical protein LshimejAT787_1302810 [Lyophyllum shimeji]|uniref:Uncharacterized protein n=1 Tax=Lyophyllum shimeji TaxID=47721 RepID=A0A9P3PUX2_LYOSH|nr:hypothetical protein LshimejAT787_1302810 [Lyophyllum shimeji]